MPTHPRRQPPPGLPPRLHQPPHRENHRPGIHTGTHTGGPASTADPGGPSGPSGPGGTSRASSSVSSDRSPYPVRVGKALCAFLEHTDPTRRPLRGGLATTVMVTIDLDTLRNGLDVALTDTGEPITEPTTSTTT